MEILFLGTGAADFLPSLADADRYRVHKDIRRSTATLLNREVLIDCGPHLMDEILLHKVDAAGIRNVLVTHLHSDHFSPDSLRALAACCEEPLHVWHHRDWEMPVIGNVTYHPMAVQQPYPVGALMVTPLAANHAAGALHYSVEAEGRKLFYGCDGAWLLMDTYYYMRDRGYDVLVVDATVGDYEGDYRMAEHNSIPMIRMMEKSLRVWGAVQPGSRIVLDHLARTLHRSHGDTCKCVEKDGYIVAYDGMLLEI